MIPVSSLLRQSKLTLNGRHCQVKHRRLRLRHDYFIVAFGIEAGIRGR